MNESFKEIYWNRILNNIRKIKIKAKNSQDNIIKYLRNLFRLKNTIKERIIKNIRNLFELEENYYKPVRVGKF